jgi:anti-sigma factor RsiW
MTCREFTEFLDAYIDHSLDPQRRAIFDQHVAACRDCAAYLNAYVRTIEAGKQAFGDADDAAPLPAEVPNGLVQAVLNARRHR